MCHIAKWLIVHSKLSSKKILWKILAFFYLKKFLDLVNHQLNESTSIVIRFIITKNNFFLQRGSSFSKILNYMQNGSKTKKLQLRIVSKVGLTFPALF